MYDYPMIKCKTNEYFCFICKNVRFIISLDIMKHVHIVFIYTIGNFQVLLTSWKLGRAGFSKDEKGYIGMRCLNA